MNLNGPTTLFIAPPGTNPGDSSAWAVDCQIDNATIDSELSTGLASIDWRSVSSVLRNVRAIRYSRPDCDNTRSVIERHFLRQHITGLLLAARQRPALLPCPLPY
ncbi:hypothetical protein ACFWRZ_08595 [Streptomyces rubiginosohelvolus]|uniref:hypothetical protein n=1 Tax=Streptomyces rubiginosohelvolus TaxID=67362 RepID=UPI00364A247F